MPGIKPPQWQLHPRHSVETLGCLAHVFANPLVLWRVALPHRRNLEHRHTAAATAQITLLPLFQIDLRHSDVSRRNTTRLWRPGWHSPRTLPDTPHIPGAPYLPPLAS